MRPQDFFTLWTNLNGRLPTKDRLMRFGIINEEKCDFCYEQETAQHLFFICTCIRFVRKEIFNLLHINRTLGTCQQEVEWMRKIVHRKEWQNQVIKLGFA